MKKIKTEKQLLSLRGKAKALDYPENVIINHYKKFDWDTISSKLTISKDIDDIVRYKQYINFYSINYDAEIPDDKLELIIDKINFDCIYNNVSHKALTKYFKYIDTYDIAKLLISGKININFIIDNCIYNINDIIHAVYYQTKTDTYYDISKFISYNKLIQIEKYINFYILSENFNLSDEIIDRYHNKINWSSISRHNQLSDYILTKYNDRLDFKQLMFNKTVPCDFIKDNIEKFINLGLLNDLISLKPELVQYIDYEKYIDLIYDFDLIVAGNPSEEFLEKHFDDFNIYNISLMCTHQKLSKEFIDKHINKLNKTELFISGNVDQDFLDKYIDSIVFYKIIAANKFNEADIEKYYEYIKHSNPDIIRYNVVSNITLSENFMAKHINDLDKKTIITYQTFSDEFASKYLAGICYRANCGYCVFNEVCKFKHILKKKGMMSE